MTSPYTVILRRRGKPEKHGCATLAEAVDLLERELRADATQARAHPRDAQGLGKTYTPEMQVVTRGELRGPGGLRAGVDVRGDGDAQAYTGRIRRQLIDTFPREDAYAALRRFLVEEQAL